MDSAVRFIITKITDDLLIFGTCDNIHAFDSRNMRQFEDIRWNIYSHINFEGKSIDKYTKLVI